VKKSVAKADVLIMAAAVADYKPASISDKKLKRGASPKMSLELDRTTDILGSVSGNFVRIGFAAESHDLIENAKGKLNNKKLDLIVGNDITATDSGIGSDNNRVVIIDRNGNAEELPLLPKREVADKILDRLAAILSNRQV
jgi:phosphopantothenoylcysteine decarboxylase/phosphopantothenate--cysteine ligase